MTRAERRARFARQKARAKRLFVCWDTSDARRVGKLARTRRPCSCIYCHGHARSWYGRTPQERRALEVALCPPITTRCITVTTPP